jgi:hypothetical protein
MKPQQKQNSRTQLPPVTTKLDTSSSRRTIPEEDKRLLSFSDVIPRSSSSFLRPANPSATQPKEEENERAFLKTAMILDYGDVDQSAELGTQLQQEENSPPSNETNTSSTFTSTFTSSFTSTSSINKINTPLETKKLFTSSETSSNSPTTSSPPHALTKEQQISLKKLREGMTLKKKTSARDLSPSKSLSPSPSSEASLLRRSRSMIFEVDSFQKEMNKSPN